MVEEPLSRWISQLRVAIEAPNAHEQMCAFFSNIEADIYNRALNDVESLLGNDIIEMDLRAALSNLRLEPSANATAKNENVVLFKRKR